MSNPTAPKDFMTAADVATEFGVSLATAKRHMASGVIPTVRIGQARYFTPECREQLHRSQGIAPIEQGWGQVTRTKPA